MYEVAVVFMLYDGLWFVWHRLALSYVLCMAFSLVTGTAFIYLHLFSSQEHRKWSKHAYLVE